jgi:hypothetical protein
MPNQSQERQQARSYPNRRISTYLLRFDDPRRSLVTPPPEILQQPRPLRSIILIQLPVLCRKLALPSRLSISDHHALQPFLHLLPPRPQTLELLRLSIHHALKVRDPSSNSRFDALALVAAICTMRVDGGYNQGFILEGLSQRLVGRDGSRDERLCCEGSLRELCGEGIDGDG